MRCLCAPARARRGAREPERGAHLQRLPPSEDAIERLALEQLHHEVRSADARIVLFAGDLLDATEVVDLDDRSMTQPTRGLRLLEESLQRHRIFRGVRQHQLQREVAIGRLVPRGPDRSHRSCADDAHEPVTSSYEVAGLEQRHLNLWRVRDREGQGDFSGNSHPERNGRSRRPLSKLPFSQRS